MSASWASPPRPSAGYVCGTRYPTNGKKATFYTSVYTVKQKHPEWFREDLALLLGLLAEGRIRPVVAERLPLEEVVRAHGRMEGAEARGKLVLLPNG